MFKNIKEKNTSTDEKGVNKDQIEIVKTKILNLIQG